LLDRLLASEVVGEEIAGHSKPFVWHPVEVAQKAGKEPHQLGIRVDDRNFVSRLRALSPEQHDPRDEQGIRFVNERAATFLTVQPPPSRRNGVRRPASTHLVAQRSTLLG
jgi:hypothetical protein